MLVGKVIFIRLFSARIFICFLVKIILSDHKHIQVATISIMNGAIFLLRLKRRLLWHGLRLLHVVRVILLAEAILNEIHAAIFALLALLVARATAGSIARGLRDLVLLG